LNHIEHAVLSEERGDLYFTDLSPHGAFHVDGNLVKKIKIVDEAEISFQERKIFISVFKTQDLEKLTQPWMHTPDTNVKSLRGSKHGGLELITPIRPNPKVQIKRWILEGYVTWKDQIYDWKQYSKGSQVYITPKMRTIRDNSAPLYAPIVEAETIIAHSNGNTALCFLSDRYQGQLEDVNGKILTNADLLRTRVKRRGHKNYFELQKGELFSSSIGENVKVFLRFAPAPPRLTSFLSSSQDLSFQQTVIASAMIHLAMVAMLVIFAPKLDGPKVEGIPPRLARLLVEPPKLLIPTPEIEKVPSKPPPEKDKPKPVVLKKPDKIKKVVFNSSKMKRVNKYPMDLRTKEAPIPVTVRSQTAVKQPEVKLQEVGVLGALGALGATDRNPIFSNSPLALKMNPNAGAMNSSNLTTEAMGALKAAGGKLASGGMMGVRSKGVGYGTGSGYGVRGIKGRGGGGRAIAGLVIGTPKLMKLERSEGLSREQVMAVLKHHLGKIQSCYETSLISNPSLAGKVEYEWTIRPTGEVLEVHVKSSEMSGGDSLNACVGKIFKSIRFPVARNGQETIPTVGFPFGKQ